jgi:hypothetical protein
MSSLPEKPVGNSPSVVRATLARFMRSNYGNAAAGEAIRHVVAYAKEQQNELAEIWLGVVEELQAQDKSAA